MTKIRFINNINGHYTLCCDGHAESAEGSNPVCAVVSDVVLALVSTLPDRFLAGAHGDPQGGKSEDFHVKNKRAEIRIVPGFAFVDVIPNRGKELTEAATCFAFALNALQWAAREWPDRIELNIEE